MIVRSISRVAAAFVVVLAVGCGDDEKSSNAGPAGTPDALCQTKCQMMSAPACPKAPANWATDCVVLCKSKYTAYPACEAQQKAIDFCAITKESYSCSTSGTIETTPIGGCAAKAQPA
jgi:hypothetical protein